MKPDYKAIGGILASVLFIGCLFGLIIYRVSDWKGDRIVSEEYVGIVKEVQIFGDRKEEKDFVTGYLEQGTIKL